MNERYRLSEYAKHLLEWGTRVKSRRILRRLELAFKREVDSQWSPDIVGRPW